MSVLDKMLSDVSGVDNREGSFAYDMLSPAAKEIESTQNDIVTIEDCYFVDTAKGIYLDRLCRMQGIERKEASNAFGTVTVTGTAETELTTEMYVSDGARSYQFTEAKTIPEEGTIDIDCICTTAGSAGNAPIGTITIIPITISGITSVTNTAAFSGGAEVESDEALLERYYQAVSTPITAGNANQYENWALSQSNVGGAKCIPIWNGAGTVKVIVCDSDMKPIPNVTYISDYINTVKPIGASVTVVSAAEKSITVAATVSIDSAYTFSVVSDNIKSAITDYFKDIALKSLTVSYAKIGAIIINTDGVTDYTLLKLDNDTANITLDAAEIPVLNVSTTFTQGA